MEHQIPKTIICAGQPRSGTTLMFRALAGLPPGSTAPRDYNGPVLKTHSFTPHEFQGPSKAVFMFGDPVASVVSTRMHRYEPGHFRNCGAADRDPQSTDIYREDALNYTRMFKNWTRRQHMDLLCIRYEALYDNIGPISSFLGFALTLPPRRPRRTLPAELLSQADLTAIQSTYEELISAVAAAPDLSIFCAAPA